MTTSGTATYNETAVEIITGAMSIIGEAAAGEAISSEDYSTCLSMLNSMIKHLAIACNLWVTKDVTITLVPGTQSYTVGTGLTISTPRPIKLIAARRRDSAGNEIEVEVVSRNDYMTLPLKSTQSPVLQVYYDPQLANGVLYCWPTGSSGNTTLIATFQRPLEDFTETGHNPDLPQEWLLPLKYYLAVMISPIFKGSVSADLKAVADQMLSMVVGFDQEKGSISFSPRGK